MLEKTKEKIKGWIDYRVIGRDEIIKIIHEETRNLKVNLGPVWSGKPTKIDLETALWMILEHLNLEAVTTEKSVKLEKKVKPKTKPPYTKKQLESRVKKILEAVEKRFQ